MALSQFKETFHLNLTSKRELAYQKVENANIFRLS